MSDIFGDFPPPLNGLDSVERSQKNIQGGSIRLYDAVIVHVQDHHHLGNHYDCRILNLVDETGSPILLREVKRLTNVLAPDGVGQYEPLHEGTPVILACREGVLDQAVIIGSFNTVGNVDAYFTEGQMDPPSKMHRGQSGMVDVNQASYYPSRVAKPEVSINLIGGSNLTSAHNDPRYYFGFDKEDVEAKSKARRQAVGIELRNENGITSYHLGPISLYSDTGINILSTSTGESDCSRLQRHAAYYAALHQKLSLPPPDASRSALEASQGPTTFSPTANLAISDRVAFPVRDVPSTAPDPLTPPPAKTLATSAKIPVVNPPKGMLDTHTLASTLSGGIYAHLNLDPNDPESLNYLEQLPREYHLDQLTRLVALYQEAASLCQKEAAQTAATAAAGASSGDSCNMTPTSAQACGKKIDFTPPNGGIRKRGAAKGNYGERTDSPSGAQGPDDISIIVYHFTSMNTADSALNWFEDPASGVSAHYTVDKDGTLYQSLDEGKRAYHAGSGRSGGAFIPGKESICDGRIHVNAVSIGIEIVNMGTEPYTEAQYQTLQWLTYDILKRRPGVKYLTGHEFVDRAFGKTDPGPQFQWERMAVVGDAMGRSLKVGDWRKPIITPRCPPTSMTTAAPATSDTTPALSSPNPLSAITTVLGMAQGIVNPPACAVIPPSPSQTSTKGTAAGRHDLELQSLLAKYKLDYIEVLTPIGDAKTKWAAGQPSNGGASIKATYYGDIGYKIQVWGSGDSTGVLDAIDKQLAAIHQQSKTGPTGGSSVDQVSGSTTSDPVSIGKAQLLSLRDWVGRTRTVGGIKHTASFAYTLHVEFVYQDPAYVGVVQTEDLKQVDYSLVTEGDYLGHLQIDDGANFNYNVDQLITLTVYSDSKILDKWVNPTDPRSLPSNGLRK